MQIYMNQFELDEWTDDADYYFQIREDYNDNKMFVLIIYDIVNNKKRVKFAKLLQGYGFRVQKSAFEAMLPKKKYEKLIREIPHYIGKEDNVRVYKITGKGQVVSWGNVFVEEEEEIILV